MTYATQQDMVDRFGDVEIRQLTDRNNAGSIDANVLSKALDDADAEINSYLAARYTLPLTSTPTVLKRVAADICRYQLYDIRATDLVRTRYEDAVKYLAGVAKGTINLGIDEVNQTVQPSGGVFVSANNRVFSASELSDY